MTHGFDGLLQGLQVLEKGSTTPKLLASEVSASPQSTERRPRILNANSLAISKNGSIYLTDSTNIPPELGRGGFYDTQKTAILSFYQVPLQPGIRMSHHFETPASNALFQVALYSRLFWTDGKYVDG